MKQEVYTLLNEMEHSADSYGEFRADADDVRNWKKTIPVKSSRRKSWKRYAAAAACICVLGTAISPVGQKAYAGVSAAMYSLSKVLGIREDFSPYLSVVGETVEKDGISATLNEVILDDETLLVSYAIHSQEALDSLEVEGGVHPGVSVSIDGAQVSFAFGGSMEEADEHTMAVYGELEVPGISTEKQMDMEMEFYFGEEMLGTIGFSVSGAELLADTKTVELDKTFRLPDGTDVTLEKYTTSDVNQKVYFTTSTGECGYDLKLEGTDDLGNAVEINMRSFLEGQGRMEVNTLDNGYIRKDAKKLTMTLYAVAFPEESGRMSNDYQQVGEPFTIALE